MDDIEPTTAHSLSTLDRVTSSSYSSSSLSSSSSSSFSSTHTLNIHLWLHLLLSSLPRVLLSSRISNEFRNERRSRDAEASHERRQRILAQAASAAAPSSSTIDTFLSSPTTSVTPTPPSPPTSATKYFIAALVSYPCEIHLDECGLRKDSCFLSHILSTPHALVHILSVPHAADLFLWRIDAMLRGRKIRDSIYLLFNSIQLDEDNSSKSERNFIYCVYDAMLAKYVEGMEIDEKSGMINAQEDGLQYSPLESSGWLLGMTKSNICSILRVLALLRKYRIPHNFMKYLLSHTQEAELDQIREYVRLTMTSDFLEPAFCIGGKNIYDQAQEWMNSNWPNLHVINLKSYSKDMHHYHLFLLLSYHPLLLSYETHTNGSKLRIVRSSVIGQLKGDDDYWTAVAAAGRRKQTRTARDEYNIYYTRR